MVKHLKGNKQIVSLSLDAALMDRVIRLADAKNRSRSAVIEELIEAGINNEEIATAAFSNPTVTKALLDVIMKPDILKALSKSFGNSGIADVEQFHQGLSMLGNYSEEIGKGGTPVEVAARTAKRVARGNNAKDGKEKKAKKS